jgi:precorrin-4 methylase
MAESAALALAEQLIQAPAKLLISRQKYAQATWHWPALRKIPIIPLSIMSNLHLLRCPAPFFTGFFMTVYFIGAGPGDPELITVKGQRLIRSCPVIIYAGSLVPAAVLAGHQAETVVNSAELHLEQIIDLIKTAHAKGQDVARVHSGDPSLYGAIGEQIRYLRELNIPFEIIPGVTATAACAALLGAELTLPDVSQSVILTRYADKTAMPAGED